MLNDRPILWCEFLSYFYWGDQPSLLTKFFHHSLEIVCACGRCGSQANWGPSNRILTWAVRETKKLRGKISLDFKNDHKFLPTFAYWNECQIVAFWLPSLFSNLTFFEQLSIALRLFRVANTLLRRRKLPLETSRKWKRAAHKGY